MEGGHLVASDITLAVGDGTRRMTYADPVDTIRDPAIRALEHTVEGLSEQLTRAGQRAALAERDAAALSGELAGLRILERAAVAEVAVLHQQLEVTERLVGALRTELAELRKTKQTALDRAKTSADEASDLRKKADDATTAERIAREEVAALSAELHARQTWGLWRRLRWGLGRKR
jgi:chromosome segregation ATPase